MAFKLVIEKKAVTGKGFVTFSTRGLILIPQSIMNAHLPKAENVAIYYDKSTKRVGLKATKDAAIGKKVGVNKKTKVCIINGQSLFEEGVKVEKAIKSPITFNKRFGGLVFSIPEEVKISLKSGCKQNTTEKCRDNRQQHLFPWPHQDHSGIQDKEKRKDVLCRP